MDPVVLLPKEQQSLSWNLHLNTLTCLNKLSQYNILRIDAAVF